MLDVYKRQVEVLCSFYGQAQLGNVVVLAVRDVGFSQQKIRGHVEQPCNFQHLLMSQGSFRTADKAADSALEMCIRDSSDTALERTNHYPYIVRLSN